MYLGTRLNVRLLESPMSTVRTWLLLANLIKGNGSPLVASYADLAEISKSVKPISKRGISKGIAELQNLGMINCERKGNVSVINLEVGGDDT